LLLVALSASAFPDTGNDLMQRQPWENCRYCHGTAPADGVPPIPVIDGQFQPYIEKQLADYRAGRRRDPSQMMQSALALLAPRDEAAVARHFGHLSPPAGPATEDWGAGATLYWNGRTGVPACAGCHGGAGTSPSLPRLFGQGKAYLLEQLRRFASSARANDRGHGMRRIAGELSAQEMEAVADYLARH
jgi:cytochrome c553